MRTKPLFATLLLMALGALPAPAWAQKLAPGLWEHSFTMKTGSGRVEAAMAQMQQQLAAMPPDQRKKMEAMMAGQGLGMGMGPGKPNTLRVCLTPEQAARDQMPQQDTRCQQTQSQRSGNVLKFKFSCSGDPPSTGEGEYTIVSDKAHKGRMVVSTVAQGQPERMEMEQSARWLAADCGSVKPRP